MVDIRALSIEDTQAYYDLRLRALTEHPTAFGQSAKEFASKDLDFYRGRFENPEPDSLLLGAFLDSEMVGIAGFFREQRLKLRHRGNIVSVYVVPAARGQGIARNLMDRLIAHARTVEGLEDIWLGVAVGNDSARNLYLACGFQSGWISLHSLKIGETYTDMELMRLHLADAD